MGPQKYTNTNNSATVIPVRNGPHDVGHEDHLHCPSLEMYKVTLYTQTQYSL